jgi:hypothetical protein
MNCSKIVLLIVALSVVSFLSFVLLSSLRGNLFENLDILDSSEFELNTWNYDFPNSIRLFDQNEITLTVQHTTISKAIEKYDDEDEKIIATIKMHSFIDCSKFRFFKQ